MVPIKEALTFDDVTLAPKYSEILPSDADTSVSLTKHLKLKIPLLSSAMDTVTESRMAIAIAKAGGIGVIHRNLDIKKQLSEIKKVKKQKLIVGAAGGAAPNEFIRAKEIIKEGADLIVVDTAHGHTKKVAEIIKYIKKINFKNLEKNLYTKNMVDPDILIRTGGHKRLSNFMLWQLAYSELYFLDKLWPDFNEKDLKKIIKNYRSIKRNFGKL